MAQRAAFTIFGQNTGSLEQTFDAESFQMGSLLKVVLTKVILPAIRQSTLNPGITELVVFPGLEGLAREIKCSFAFEH